MDEYIPNTKEAVLKAVTKPHMVFGRGHVAIKLNIKYSFEYDPADQGTIQEKRTHLPLLKKLEDQGYLEFISEKKEITLFGDLPRYVTRRWKAAPRALVGRIKPSDTHFKQLVSLWAK